MVRPSVIQHIERHLAAASALHLSTAERALEVMETRPVFKGFCSEAVAGVPLR
jgi:hypothetical protein